MHSLKPDKEISFFVFNLTKLTSINLRYRIILDGYFLNEIQKLTKTYNVIDTIWTPIYLHHLDQYNIRWGEVNDC